MKKVKILYQLEKIMKQSEENNDVNKEDEKDKMVDISLTKDILPFIIPLICILTINTDHTDVLEMLKLIKDDSELIKVFEDQSFIWWNQPNVIKFITFIEDLIGKYIKKDSYIYNISLQFKMSLQNLIDNQKLLELIDSCLKPKESEKVNTEVFTL
jgi:hypothetical protein